MADELVPEETPAIDLEILDELEHAIGDDRRFLRELVETYLEDAPGQLATIRAGIESGEVEPVNRAAHTLKSNSRSIGATTLAELCLGLQEATSPATTEAADLATPEIAHRVTAISAELNRVMSELDSLVPPNAG